MYQNGCDQRDVVQFFHPKVLRDTLGVPSPRTPYLSITPFQWGNPLQRQDHPPQNFEVWSVGRDSSFAIVPFHEHCPRALASTSLTVSEEFSRKEDELVQWLNISDVRRYQNKNLDSLVSMASVDGYFFIPSLKHCTAHSANPLLDG